MAITFFGSSSSMSAYGNDSTTQNVFTMSNGIKSRVNVNIRRLALQNDNLVVLTAVMPIVRTSRCTNITGGNIINRAEFDSTYVSDSNIEVRSNVQERTSLAATPGTIVWQQYTQRMHTLVENVNSAFDCNALPFLIEQPNKQFILRPGEAICVQIISAVGTSNPAQSNNWVCCCDWEEEPISTYAISGTVTLGGSGVTGAQVTVIEADDEALTNAYLKEVITTPAGGTWTSNIRTGKIAYVYYQYKNGATYYTAPGSPYIS